MVEQKGTLVRYVVSAIFSAACALSLAHCSHRENMLAVSPPLPPAEEPKDDVAGAYVDAGAPGAPEVKDDGSEGER